MPTRSPALFEAVEDQLGAPHLVVHNIDGRFARHLPQAELTEAEPASVAKVVENSAFSAFLVGQQAARRMLERPIPERRPPRHDPLHERERGA